MEHRTRAVLAVAILLSAGLLTGCFFNIFQTARTVGQGNVALGIGAAALNMVIGDDNNWMLTPQGRISIGLADNVDLGVRSGGMFSFTSGELGFLGAVGDIKVSLFHDPELLSLALGFGGGYSMGMFGWGLEGSVYLDSNIWILPIYFVYRPLFPLTGDGVTVLHQLGGGLHLTLSENTRLLIEVDYWQGILSFGISLEILL